MTTNPIERHCKVCGRLTTADGDYCPDDRKHMLSAATYDPRRATKDEILRGGEWVHDRHGIQRWQPFRRPA